jgi:hypothetical protein
METLCVICTVCQHKSLNICSFNELSIIKRERYAFCNLHILKFEDTFSCISYLLSTTYPECIVRPLCRKPKVTVTGWYSAFIGAAAARGQDGMRFALFPIR